MNRISEYTNLILNNSNLKIQFEKYFSDFLNNIEYFKSVKKDSSKSDKKDSSKPKKPKVYHHKIKANVKSEYEKESFINSKNKFYIMLPKNNLNIIDIWLNKN